MYQDSNHSLLAPAVCVRALDVTVSQSSIQVARGQAAILPCSFTTSAALNNLNIIWMVIPLSNANQPEQLQAVQAHLPPFTLNSGAGRPSK
ncbi:immunoglobulin superfamily member 11 [Lates japonicus]|nr:immunoglobulin superfamily member 11 [Lates japonicus]GLD72635.1 immunoglobulin superfamily member 11 [Lates japonicus]